MLMEPLGKSGDSTGEKGGTSAGQRRYILLIIVVEDSPIAGHKAL
jgi:hypothetical protein